MILPPAHRSYSELRCLVSPSVHVECWIKRQAWQLGRSADRLGLLKQALSSWIQPGARQDCCLTYSWFNLRLGRPRAAWSKAWCFDSHSRFWARLVHHSCGKLALAGLCSSPPFDYWSRSPSQTCHWSIDQSVSVRVWALYFHPLLDDCSRSFAKRSASRHCWVGAGCVY